MILQNIPKEITLFRWLKKYCPCCKFVIPLGKINRELSVFLLDISNAQSHILEQYLVFCNAHLLEESSALLFFCFFEIRIHVNIFHRFTFVNTSQKTGFIIFFDFHDYWNVCEITFLAYMYHKNTANKLVNVKENYRIDVSMEVQWTL